MFNKQNKAFLIIALMLSLVLLAGCSQGKTETKTGSVDLKYATKFKIENLADNCKKVTDGEGRELLLVPRGQEAPTEYKDLPVINTPVKRVVVVSTTHSVQTAQCTAVGRRLCAQYGG